MQLQAKNTIGFFIRRFVLHAGGYLIEISTDRSSAEIQNLAISLLSRANGSLETFTSVMVNIVNIKKSNADYIKHSIPTDASGSGKVNKLLLVLTLPRSQNSLLWWPKGSMACLPAAGRRHNSIKPHTSFGSYISPADAIIVPGKLVRDHTTCVGIL